MTDDIEKLEPVLEPVSAQPAPDAIPVPPKKSKKTLWIILVTVLAVICLCGGVIIALVSTGLYTTFKERAPVEAVMNTLMTDMAARDVESAYALFSPRAKRQVTQADLEKLLVGNNYVIFEGYESLSVQNINLTAAANTDPEMAQGIIATATGSITYADGFTGSFKAVLEKVDGTWMFHSFNVTVPPDKLRNNNNTY
jgi:hypothetical protein